MNDTIIPIPVLVPGAAEWLLLLAVCMVPLGAWLALVRIMPERTASLPEPMRAGIPLFAGLVGVMLGVIGIWLVSANGAWVEDDTFKLRASRAFVAEVPVQRLELGRAVPVRLDSLESEGRVRSPRYAAGWYRDVQGRRIFLLYAGEEMLRIPTREDFDIAFTPSGDAIERLQAAATP